LTGLSSRTRRPGEPPALVVQVVDGASSRHRGERHGVVVLDSELRVSEDGGIPPREPSGRSSFRG
jgi:hypothetical protein